MRECMCRKPKIREFDGQGSFKYDPSREKYKHTYKVCKDWLSFVDMDTKPKAIRENFINIPYTLSLIWYFIQFKSHQVKRLAKHLQGVDDLQTSYNIWHFAKFNVPYEVEKGEQVHSAAVTLQKASKGLPGDCDDFVVLCGSLLFELNIYFEVVLSGYDKENPKRFTHIFIKVPKSGGEFYTIDPVWSNFEANQYPAFNQHKIKVEMALGQFQDDSFTAGLGQFSSGGAIDMLNGYEDEQEDLGDYSDFELVDQLEGGAELVDQLNGDMDENMQAYLDGYEDALDESIEGMEDNFGLLKSKRASGGARGGGATGGGASGGGASGSQIKIGAKNPIIRSGSAGRTTAISATQRAANIQAKAANLIQSAKTANQDAGAGAGGGGGDVAATGGGGGATESKTLIAGIPNWMLIAGVVVLAAIAWWAFGAKKKTRRR